MIVAGGEEIISLHMFWFLLVLAATAAGMVFYFRLRRLRRAARVVRPSAHDLPVGVEISCAEFDAMKADMELGPIGDGLDPKGQPFTIARYRSRATGKRYDYVTSAAGSRVIQYPAPPDSGEGVTRSRDAP
jgi:hypothetical protein